MFMQPTAHLRFSATSGKLQQGWASLDGGHFEWRDVQMEEKSPTPKKKSKKAFDPNANCEKNHRECEAPEICGRSGRCMGA